MLKKIIIILALLLIIIFQTGLLAKETNVSVENKMNIERFETISVGLVLENYTNISNFIVFDSKGTQLVSQLIDSNMDGEIDQIIFQDSFQSFETKTYTIKESSVKSDFSSKVDVIFVEGREDIAWESNKVAFRMYGPPLINDVSNGIDVWTKRVEELIVAKWYKEEGEGISYHVDHGEGADFFSVGKSLGSGGSALYNGDSLFQSGVYKKYEIIDNGPIRARFLLIYEFYIDTIKIVENKIISIDANSYLNKIITHYSKIPDGYKFVAGLIIRDGLTIIADNDNSIVSLWGNISKNKADGELGTAVIFNNAHNIKITKDENHLLLISPIIIGEEFTHYTGAGWSRQSENFNKETWINYLKLFKKRLNNPLIARVVE